MESCALACDREMLERVLRSKISTTEYQTIAETLSGFSEQHQPHQYAQPDKTMIPRLTGDALNRKAKSGQSYNQGGCKASERDDVEERGGIMSIVSSGLTSPLSVKELQFEDFNDTRTVPDDVLLPVGKNNLKLKSSHSKRRRGASVAKSSHAHAAATPSKSSQLIVSRDQKLIAIQRSPTIPQSNCNAQASFLSNGRLATILLTEHQH